MRGQRAGVILYDRSLYRPGSKALIREYCRCVTIGQVWEYYVGVPLGQVRE